MKILADVRKVCTELVDSGWNEVFLKHGLKLKAALDLDDTEFAKKLSEDLNINRKVPGFDDFSTAGRRAIEAGKPAASLLYHAMASPFVHPDGSDRAGDPAAYPTLKHLDTIENYIYSLVSDRTDLNDTIVAVFAYQYRVASRTSHLQHADMAYSRTGVARVGTAELNYDQSRRSFWVLPADGKDRICVLPARYGAFLARRAKPGAVGSVQGGDDGPNDDDFVFPVHKLFAGNECLNGQNLGIKFLEFHRNEKLKLIHQPLGQKNPANQASGLPVPDGFDITKPPYVRDSKNGGNLASLQEVGSSALVVPTLRKTLNRTAIQKNHITKKDQLVHFLVPPSSEFPRFAFSSLRIPSDPKSGARFAPEFVNIRHKIDPNGPVTQIPDDINKWEKQEFKDAITNGGYPAAHFVDDSCDGSVEAVITGLPAGLPSQGENLPAFSLITAPDFFPLADQIEVHEKITQSKFEPLSLGNLPANLTLPRRSDPNSKAFKPNDKTITRIIGDVGTASGRTIGILGHPNRMVSYLPDAASNVFAPGWDTSISKDNGNLFFTSSGLGSPFPEDAKLCAALASYWPAVAPDNGRTFGNVNNFENELPMLDEELGFHPKHKRVLSTELDSYHGWDGEFGPFYEEIGAKLYVNYVAISRSDYVSQALAGRIGVSLTAEVQSEELIARRKVLFKCRAILRGQFSDHRCLVVFRKIDDWEAFGAALPQIRGSGYLLDFADLTGVRKKGSKIPRVREEVTKQHIFQVAANEIAYKNGDAAFKPHSF